MNKLFNVSTSPHIRSQVNTTTIMADVIIALIPVSAWSVYQNGWAAFWLIISCILASVLSEYAYEKLMKKKSTIHDLSAFVTGLLLALNLPVTMPIWMAVLGSVFAIIVVKMLFGGIGQNFMNPALAARCFLSISFASSMANYFAADATSGATPLAVLKTGDTAKAATDVLANGGYSVMDLFLGRSDAYGALPGVIGETSVLMILIGAAYLLIKRIISWRIPVMYVASFAVFIALFGGYGLDPMYIVAEICGGGLMLGAVFMATDYSTSPITARGQIVYGIVLGFVTAVLRIFSGSAEGVSYAIIFCNLLVPLIERVTLPRAFGKEAKGRAKM